MALALAAIVAVLLFASPAQAAPTRQIVLGHGQHPSIVLAVGPDGNSVVHAVWATTSGFDESERVLNAIGYCWWRLGTPVCRDRKTLLVMGREGDFSAPEITSVLEQKGSGLTAEYTPILVITDSRCCGADQSGRWVLMSRDKGATWGSARVSGLGSAHGSMLHRAGMLELVPPGLVQAPAGTSLTTVGGGFASFGFPVAVEHIPDLNSPPGPPRTDFADFVDDGVQRVYTEGLGLLPDGRPFAVGYPTSDRGGAAFMRTVLPGANPANVPGGWTPWQPFALPKGRESSGTVIEDVAWLPQSRPALLEREFLGANDVLWSVPLNGTAPGRRTLVAGETNNPVAPIGSGSLAVVGSESYALWVTQGEACPRGRRCLVFRKTEDGDWTGPHEVVRSVRAGGPYIEDATLSVGFSEATTGIWTERRQQGSGLPQVRLAWLCSNARKQVSNMCQRHEWREDRKHNAAFARLGAPSMVTGRSFTATVKGNHIDRVRVSLLPPTCRPPSTGDSCFAFRRAVRSRADGTAPYTARFTRLPVNPNASTISVWKNKLCGIDAYLYRLVARVRFDKGLRTTLERDVSVCPPLT